MSNVQVRNIPDDVHEQLRARAGAADSTISDYVLELIRRDLRRPSRKEWIAQVLATPKLDISDAEVARIRDELRLERDGNL